MVAQKIAIFGAGGFAREVLQVILDINESGSSGVEWQPVGFVVDPDYVSDKFIHGLPILGSINWLIENPDVFVVVAIGASDVRKKVAVQIENESENRFATLVHPNAWVGRNVVIEAGSVICAGALITTDIHIGKHVHINIGCTIGHDAVLHDYVTLNPSVNVSGNVEIGVCAEVGTKSVLIPFADVGESSVIGAGAVVIKPIPANATAVGIPAKVIKVT